jgi:hypothetical protein
VGALTLGAEIDVIGEIDDFYVFLYNGENAFILKSDVSEEAPEIPEPTPISIPDNTTPTTPTQTTPLPGDMGVPTPNVSQEGWCPLALAGGWTAVCPCPHCTARANARLTAMPPQGGFPITDGYVGEGLVNWINRRTTEDSRSFIGQLYFGGSEEEARRIMKLLRDRATAIETGTWVLPIPTSSPAYRYYEEAYRLMRLGILSVPVVPIGGESYGVELYSPEVDWSFVVLCEREAVNRAIQSILRWLFDTCGGSTIDTLIRFDDDTGLFIDSNGNGWYHEVRFPRIESAVRHTCHNALSAAESAAWNAWLDERGIREWYNEPYVEDYRLR